MIPQRSNINPIIFLFRASQSGLHRGEKYRGIHCSEICLRGSNKLSFQISVWVPVVLPTKVSVMFESQMQRIRKVSRKRRQLSEERGLSNFDSYSKIRDRYDSESWNLEGHDALGRPGRSKQYPLLSGCAVSLLTMLRRNLQLSLQRRGRSGKIRRPKLSPFQT